MQTVPASPALVAVLLKNMGADRVTKLRALVGGDPIIAIGDNIRRSTLTWCGVADRSVVTMGGVWPMVHPDTGYVWQFVAGVAAHKRAYLEQGRVMMQRGLQQYARLLTIIEADYPAALRHVRRNGWMIGEPEMMNGVMACRCERVR